MRQVIAMQESKQINTAVYYTNSFSGEQYTGEILFSYQISGSLQIQQNNKVSHYPAGSFRLVRQNRVIKYIKQANKSIPYRSLSVVLRKEMLRSFADAHGYSPRSQPTGPSVILLKKAVLYQSLISSLISYSEINEGENRQLIDMKVQEILFILLKEQPELQNVLFDFSVPVKSDLAGFMEKNFRYNLPLSRFAYLSGRSLASYKRDFINTFFTSPGKWLLNRRLEEAKILLSRIENSPSKIYLNIGFEDLSHFSRAFTFKFGITPSKFCEDAKRKLDLSPL